jgi:excinuclease ABC subunit A
MKFLPDITETCEVCNGSGYRAEACQVYYEGVSLPEVNNLTIEEAYELFKDFETISLKLFYAKKVGLGYLKLNQPARTLSGGEAQRLKIVKELSKKTNKKTLYILDEPTIGQHLDDVSNLIDVLQLLVDNGHTVLVIEHHPHVLASCDWIIELGPGAGPKGGRIIFNGSPEEMVKNNTPTTPYLKKVLEGAI